MGMAMIEREAKIVKPLGMHVRPAAGVRQGRETAFKSEVEVRKDDVASTARASWSDDARG